VEEITSSEFLEKFENYENEKENVREKLSSNPKLQTKQKKNSETEKEKKKFSEEKEEENLLLLEHQTHAIETKDYNNNSQIHEILDEAVVIIERKINIQFDDLDENYYCEENFSEEFDEDFNKLNGSIFSSLNEKREEGKRKTSKSKRFEEWKEFVQDFDDVENINFEKRKRKRNK
jgi:hypothetical protein